MHFILQQYKSYGQWYSSHITSLSAKLWWFLLPYNSLGNNFNNNGQVLITNISINHIFANFNFSHILKIGEIILQINILVELKETL